MADRQTEFPMLAPLRDALAAEPGWWSTLFEAANLGMKVLDETGRVVAVTPSLTRMLDRRRDELLALGLDGISHPDDLPEDRRLLAELVAGDRDRYELEKRFIRGDGESLWCHMTVTSVSAPSGAGRWFVGLVQDIQDRKDADLRLRRFIAEASHELRAPVAVISAAAELLLDSRDPAEHRELVETLHGRTRHLSRLVSMMLDLSRLDAGAPLALTSLPVRAAITAAIELSGANGRVQAADVAEDLVVVADPTALQQALTNLLTNAARYGQPPIVVAGRPEGRTVVISVRDHGRGLSDDTVDQLFRPYSRSAKGAGLGLAITRAAVESMDGSVWFEPADPGARFLIRLPAPDG